MIKLFGQSDKWILLGLNSHAKKLIFLKPFPANKMELFRTWYYAQCALRTPEALFDSRIGPNDIKWFTVFRTMLRFHKSVLWLL